ncbi:dTDP-4-dehydrorhamnose 3,5-epimerase [Rhodobacter sp.]
MIFHPTPLPGLVEVAATPHCDARGSFARAFCADEFRAAGIPFQPVQTNLSTNTAAFTLRGLHFQNAPFAETKLVRAVSGRAFDVAVDLRPGPTCGRWHGVELSAKAKNALFIPEGFAHGFLTLESDTTLLYQMAPAHVAGHAAGIRWDDPNLGIQWPALPEVISAADAALPGWSDVASARPSMTRP